MATTYATIDLTSMTCPEDPASVVLAGTAVAIAPGFVSGYFHLSDLPALNSAKTYEFQVDYDNAIAGAYFAAYSQQSADVDGYNNSYWETLSQPTLPQPSGTVTFRMGPGIEQWDNKLGLNPPEPYVIFDLTKFRLTGLRYAEIDTGVTPAAWLSVNDPDDGIGDIEGDICVLDSGLVVVARMSSYSYAITLQAIDPTTTPPTIGPEKYANLDYVYTDPGYEVFANKLDPGGQVWNDVGSLSPMGGNIFCQSGGVSDYINAEGEAYPDPYTSGPTYTAAASVYTVDPATLEISLVKHAGGEFDTVAPYSPATEPSWYADESTTARWGNKTIVLPSQNAANRYQMAVVSPDGTCDIINVPATVTNASRPGPVMCSGNVGVLLSEHNLSGPIDHGSLVSFNPANGAFISTIPCPIDSSWQWSVFAATMPNGLIAMITPGESTVITGSSAPVWVMVIDPDPLAIVKHFEVSSALHRMVGWTGGWYSNVRSIDVYPNGDLLISAVNSTTRKMKLFRVDPVTEAVTALDAPPFSWFNSGNNFISQAVVLDNDEYAAIWAATRSSNYGVYYSQSYEVVPPTVPSDWPRSDTFESGTVGQYILPGMSPVVQGLDNMSNWSQDDGYELVYTDEEVHSGTKSITYAPGWGTTVHFPYTGSPTTDPESSYFWVKVTPGFGDFDGAGYIYQMWGADVGETNREHYGGYLGGILADNYSDPNLTKWYIEFEDAWEPGANGATQIEFTTPVDWVRIDAIYAGDGGLTLTVSNGEGLTYGTLTKPSGFTTSMTPPQAFAYHQVQVGDFGNGRVFLDDVNDALPIIPPDTRIVWNEPKARYFEAGLDRGVLYPRGGQGVPWNGLISVDEDGADGDVTYYVDGEPYLHMPKRKEFSATLNAYTYPNEFGEMLGLVRAASGMYVDSQRARKFGLCYRTKIGNAIGGIDEAYKLHLIYNAVVIPQSHTYETLSDTINPTTLSWQIQAVPVTVAGFHPTAHIIIDSRHLSPAKLSLVEDILYGGGIAFPTLPDPQLLYDVLGFGDSIVVIDNGDGTFEVKGSNSNVYMIDVGIFQVDNVIGQTSTDGTYTISSTPG